MTQIRLGGPGVDLPYPQALFPAFLIGAGPQPATNLFSLAAGTGLPVPAGDWMVSGAPLQFNDPVTGGWITMGGTGNFSGQVHSDGQNFRVMNLEGLPTTATITAAGANYQQATTNVTASAGGSQWQPIIGGAVSAPTVVSGGSGYTVPPIVLIAAPPSPGVQATATAAINAAGVVTGITLTAAGAGYTTPPMVMVLPSPFDPNFGSIVGATASVALTGAGTLTGLICLDYGSPETTAPTLSITGSGSGATATVALTSGTAADTVWMQPL